MKVLKVCDFFSGCHSWTKGFDNIDLKDTTLKVFSIDNNADYKHNTTMIMDFLKLTPKMIIDYFGGKPDLILASPPCTSFSVASLHHHWGGGIKQYVPKTEAAKIGIKIVKHLLYLIEELGCIYFFENPRGILRKLDFMQPYDSKKHYIWYCQYGETKYIGKRAKPTDIWTNSKTWISRPPCKRSNPECDHIRAPMGSNTHGNGSGLKAQDGMSKNVIRSLIPTELTQDIIESALEELGVEFQ